MIDYYFTHGNPSIHERELIKEKWLSNLKEFRKEFEEKAASVTFDLTANPDTSLYAQFTFKDNMAERMDFIRRFQLVYPPKGV